MNMPTLAGMLCHNPEFQKHLGVTSPESAAAHVRQHCGIACRRELDFDAQAATLFHQLRRQSAYGEAI